MSVKGTGLGNGLLETFPLMPTQSTSPVTWTELVFSQVVCSHDSLVKTVVDGM